MVKESGREKMGFYGSKLKDDFRMDYARWSLFLWIAGYEGLLVSSASNFASLILEGDYRNFIYVTFALPLFLRRLDI